MSDLPRHRYAYAIDPASPTAPARALARVATGSTVLELGPGAGSMTRKLAEMGCHVVAVERDPECRALAAPYCSRIIAGDLEQPDEWLQELAGERFATILACDVLEHLIHPERLLTVLPSLLAPRGELVITLPNVAHLGVVAALLADAFPYAEKGLLDATHLRFFTRPSTETLLSASGWVPLYWEPIPLAPQYSEFAPFWAQLPTALQEQLTATCPHGEVYQWLVASRPAAALAEEERQEAERHSPRWLYALKNGVKKVLRWYGKKPS